MPTVPWQTNVSDNDKLEKKDQVTDELDFLIFISTIYLQWEEQIWHQLQMCSQMFMACCSTGTVAEMSVSSAGPFLFSVACQDFELHFAVAGIVSSYLMDPASTPT